MYLFYTFMGAILANVIYVYVSFDEAVRNDAWKIYPIGVFGSMIAGASWIYMIRHLEHKHIFFANFAWDVTVTVLCVMLPIFMYNVKLDFRAILGSILAIIGIIIIHFGNAK